MAGGLLFLFWYVIPIAFAIMVVNFLRNVAKIRRALERLAAAAESSRPPGGGGVLGI